MPISSAPPESPSCPPPMHSFQCFSHIINQCPSQVHLPHALPVLSTNALPESPTTALPVMSSSTLPILPSTALPVMSSNALPQSPSTSLPILSTTALPKSSPPCCHLVLFPSCQLLHLPSCQLLHFPSRHPHAVI